MKALTRLMSLFALATTIVSFVACGGGGSDPEPVIEETQKEKVTKLLQASGSSWTPSSTGITVDNADASQLFEGFTIKFGDGTLTTTGTTPVWLRSDTWTFKNDDANVIIRGQDNKEISIESVSDTQLKLSLQWDQYTYEDGGRKKSIPGNYVFTLTK